MRVLKAILKRVFIKNRRKNLPLFNVTKRLGIVIQKYSKGKCLDAGCGIGAYFSLLNAEKIIGLDLTKKYLNKIDVSIFHPQKIELVKGDVRKLPFKKDTFDFVLCSEVFEYVPEKDIDKAIKELDRVCVKNGIIVISVPNKSILNVFRDFLYDNKYGEPNEGCTNMGRVFTKEELEKYGFEVHSCFGYVSRNDARFEFIFDVLDFFAWYWQKLGGTLIGIKKGEYYEKVQLKHQ